MAVPILKLYACSPGGNLTEMSLQSCWGFLSILETRQRTSLLVCLWWHGKGWPAHCWTPNGLPEQATIILLQLKRPLSWDWSVWHNQGSTFYRRVCCPPLLHEAQKYCSTCEITWVAQLLFINVQEWMLPVLSLATCPSESFAIWQ